MALAVARTTYRFPNAGGTYNGEVYPDGWLSPSQITEYLMCPRCFEWNRIYKHPKAMAIDLPIGGAIHKAVESWRHDFLSDVTQPAEAHIAAAEEHFDRNLEADIETGGEILVDLKGFSDEGQAKDLMVKLAKFALTEVATLDGNRGLIAAELDLTDLAIESPYPFPVVGRIDALYGQRQSDDLVPTLGNDLKSSKKQEAPGLNAVIQTTIYDEHIGPIPWLVDVLAKTQTPSFRTYSASYDPEQRQRIHDLVLDVAEQINRGYFPPRPGWACKYDHGFAAFSSVVHGFGDV